MQLLLQFSLLAAAFIVSAVYQLYLNQMLQIRWRRWLTDRYLEPGSASRTYYRMQLTDRGTDNPDQRIAEDLALFVDKTLSSHARTALRGGHAGLLRHYPLDAVRHARVRAGAAPT